MILTLLLAALGIAVQTDASAPPELRSLPHAEVSAALRELATTHPNLCELVPVGTSRAGRSIEALRIGTNDEEGGRPAILVMAALEGPMAYTSALALHHARELATSYGTNESITALLDRTTVYVIARANPDACEARHQAPLAERRATGHGVDNDRDGRNGEDDVADVDGDGIVAWMRYEDPEGTWIADPTDARVLIEAQRAKGERGRYRLVREARDADGDEALGEDPVHDAEVNRNFAHAFEEHTPRAGLFPTHEPETRALCEFVLAHRDIALVVVYGEVMNLAKDPKTAPDSGRSRGRIPPREVLSEDGGWLGELGRRYRATTGNTAKGADDDAGTFQGWAYHHRGLATLCITPFEVPIDDKSQKAARGEKAPVEESADAEEAPKAEESAQSEETPKPEAAADAPKSKDSKPSDDAKRLVWLEANGAADAHLGWSSFEHPELGPVEIGGWRPYALAEPPAALGADIAKKHFEFLVSLGDVLARPRFVEVNAHELAPGLFEVTGVLENDALLPMQTAAARRARTVRPARVTLEETSGVLAGPLQELVRELAGAGGRHELRWLVQAPSGSALRVSFDTDHAGRQSISAEVNR